MKFFITLCLLTSFLVYAEGVDNFQEEKPWVLSGYLPLDSVESITSAKRVWLVLHKGKIHSIYLRKRTLGPLENYKTIIETDGYLFPGMIDIHNHLRYNVLPLWELAKGQFKNRFEWRNKYPPYKDAVREKLRGFQGFQSVCDASKWAELKALTAGTTSILGAGGIAKCLHNFGVNNLEDPSTFLDVEKKIELATDIVTPDIFKKIYLGILKPIVDKEGITLQQALAKYKRDEGIDEWFEQFQKLTPSVDSALKILLGDKSEKIILSENVKDLKASLQGQLESLIQTEFAYNEKKSKTFAEKILNWIYSPDRPEKAYLKSTQTKKEAFQFFKNAANFRFPYYVRSFITDILGGLETFQKKKREGKLAAFVSHLAEGRSDDEYNSFEYEYARNINFAQEGFVIIHGLGLSEKDLAHAKRSNLSFVWSPFSNLLLYNETLDYQKLRELGINVSLAPDWSITGSKNLLDEIKFTRNYLDKKGIEYNYVELYKMVTENPAKAVGLDKHLGKIKRGYNADIIVVDRISNNPYKAFVEAEQKNMQLVVVSGDPLYGNSNHIQKYSKEAKDIQVPFELPIKREISQNCNFKKSIRSYYPENKVEKIETDLNNYLLASTEEKGYLLDPLFRCEDGDYVQRFNQFVSTELDQNIMNYKKNRIEHKLDKVKK